MKCCYPENHLATRMIPDASSDAGEAYGPDLGISFRIDFINAACAESSDIRTMGRMVF